MSQCFGRKSTKAYQSQPGKSSIPISIGITIKKKKFIKLNKENVHVVKSAPKFHNRGVLKSIYTPPQLNRTHKMIIRVVYDEFHSIQWHILNFLTLIEVSFGKILYCDQFLLK